jgi:hypothetical protein
MNKIQELIDNGTITRKDVIDFITDEYDQQMIDQAQEEEDEDYQDGDIDPEEDRDELLESIISGEYDPDPEYVILSTSHYGKETYVFPSNEKGNIKSRSEIIGLAQRWDNTDDYLDTFKVLKALNQVTGHGYTFVEKLCDNSTHKQLLYKRDDL